MPRRRPLISTLWAVCVVALLAVPGRAAAYISPTTVVAGPTAGILGVGDAALAPDGTGGVVWRQLYDGVPHIFVSQFKEGSWGPAIEVDAGMPGPATSPVLAAGDGGELLVAWVAPWVSESTGGQAPTTLYQLFSAVMQPGSSIFTVPTYIDHQNVGDGSGVDPSLAMAPDGDAYVAYRVVTNSLSPGVTQPQGTLTPLRPGDEIEEIRVAHFDGQNWTPMGQMNAFPGQVTMRAPTPDNAPVVAIAPSDQGLVVWQEPSIDGVARIWGRRLFGTTVGYLLPLSPTTLDGQPVTADADAPSVSMGESANAQVAFRIEGGLGNPLTTAHAFTATLFADNIPGASAFSTPMSVGGGATLGPPSVAVDDRGDYELAFEDNGQAELVSSVLDAAPPPVPSAPQAVGGATGDPTMATLDPDGGGAAIWPGANSAGLPVVQVRDTLPDGGYQHASLSAPISGPMSSLSIGPSGLGDALVTWEQGFGSTAQVATAFVQAPPHGQDFIAFVPDSWVKPHAAVVSWQPVQSVIGSVTYSVVVDGHVEVKGFSGTRFRLRARGLGTGTHRVQLIATDQVGQQTVAPVSTIKVVDQPPFVVTRRLRHRGIRVVIRDRGPGARARGTLISFGDGTPPVRNRLAATHRYAATGVFDITVRCSDRVGDRATDHLEVSVR